VNLSKAAATAAPSLGPAVVTVLGTDVPILALFLSCGGLLLARVIAPPPLRKLSRLQHWSLTTLLLIVLFLIVTGQFTGQPLEPGMAVVWGIGLGFSGLVVVELFADRVISMLKVLFGGTANAD
jgi:hypothetical protein